jgi:hypothetical protein
MATNEILPFASTDTGTNLLTQAEYSADAQRTTGNQPGIARSKLVNKSLRQVSLLAAGLAQFLANKQSTNVTDNLTASQIADMLVEAIKADYLRRDGTNAMTARLRGKMGAPLPNNTNNAGIVFDGDEDSGLFSTGDANLQIAINGIAQMLFNGGQAIKSSKQIRVPAGAPNASNASDAAGFAFADSGDTGLFWEGTSDGIRGGTLRLRMDGGTVAYFDGNMLNANTTGWVRTSAGMVLQWGEAYASVGTGGGWTTITFPRSFGSWARVFVTNTGDGDEAGEEFPFINWSNGSQARIDWKRISGSAEPAPQYVRANWFAIGN